MTKVSVGDKFGLFTVLMLTPGHYHCLCECGTYIDLPRKLKNSGRGRHCGCLHCDGTGDKPAPVKGWGDRTPRNKEIVTAFDAWCDMPQKGRMPYLDLMRVYRDSPPPVTLTLRDPSKPATIDNIQAEYS